MFKNHKLSLLVAWLAALFLLPFPFILTFVLGFPAAFSEMKVSVALGIVAYVWMLLAIYVASKPKWLDRLIGLPAAYMIHGILSLVAIVFAFFHKSALPSSGLVQITGNVAFMIFISVATYSMVFMAGWLTSRIPTLEKIKHGLERVLKHEISIWLHRLNILATVLVFIHVQLIGYIRSNTAFMMLFYAYSLFVFGSYLWAKFKPTSKGINAKLIANRKIAENIQEIVVKLPRHNVNKIKAGDFAFISFPRIKGMGEPHPFSVVNNPYKTDELVFAIRGDGDFTRKIAEIEVPEHVHIDASYGMFQNIIDEQKPNALLIITGGIGITPMLSIIDANPTIPTVVFNSASSEDSLIYQEKFDEWNKRQYFKAFRQVGRFDEDEIVDILPEDLSAITVLISGPTAMGRHWVKLMKDHGMPSEKVFFEEFSW